MKTLHTVTLTVCITFATFSAFGTEKIEGAFGKKFGDVFDPASAIGDPASAMTGEQLAAACNNIDLKIRENDLEIRKLKTRGLYLPESGRTVGSLQQESGAIKKLLMRNLDIIKEKMELTRKSTQQLPPLADGTPMYEFSTTNGFRSFRRYGVLITPVTKKIYSIWGISAVSDTNLEQEQALVTDLLRQKYGAKEDDGLKNSLDNVLRIDQGNRYILTVMTKRVSTINLLPVYTLNVRYYDRDLDKLAEKERLAEEAKKVDKSGL